MSAGRRGPFTQITINGKTYKDESARETIRTQSVTDGGQKSGPFTQITIKGKTYKDETTRAQEGQKARPAAATPGTGKVSVTQGLGQGIKQVAQQVGTMVAPTQRSETPKQTTVQTRKRDDGAVRANYAARHPEETGGELGAIRRGVRSGEVYLTAGEKELEELRAAYDADPTDEKANAFNSRLATFQRDAVDYKGYIDRQKTYYSPEGYQGRIDTMEAQIKDLQSRLEAQQAVTNSAAGEARRTKVWSHRAAGLGAPTKAEVDRAVDKAAQEKSRSDNIQKQIGKLQAQIQQEKLGKTVAEYEVLRSNPDFEEKSAYNPNFGKPIGKAQYYEDSETNNWYLMDSGYEDIAYDAINGDKTAQEIGATSEGLIYNDVPEAVAQMFNYIYATQDKEAAYKYLDLMAERRYSGLYSLQLGMMDGLGVLSATKLLGAGISNVMGEPEAAGEIAGELDKITGQAKHQNPLLYGIGNVGGRLGILSGVGSALGSAEGALAEGVTIGGKTVAFQMSPALQGTVNSSLTFLADDAIRNAGDVAVGNITPVEYLESMGISGAQGLVGSVAGNLVGTGIADVLTKNGMMTPFMEFVRQSASGIAFSGASVGTGYILREEKPTGEQIAIDLATAFLFSVIQSGISTYTTTQDAKMRLETAIDQIGQEYSQMTQGWESMTLEARVETATRILEQTQNLRTTLNSTYMAGQQATADQLNQAFDGIVEGLQWYIDFAQAYQGATTAPSNMLGSGVPGVSGGIAVPALAQSIGDPDVFMDEQIGGDSLLAGVDRAADILSGQEKTAPLEEAGKVYHGQILDTVRQHLDKVQGMPTVAKLTGSEFQKQAGDNRSLKAKVIDFFNSLGNKVTRPDIGDIELNNAGARDSTAHGYGKLKAATFAALPSVLKDGKIVLQRGPYEGHGYDSIFIVAPVDIGDLPCYVGALVIKDVNTQRYKLHEVLTTTEDGTPLFKSETAQDGQRLRNEVPFKTIIPQTAQEVNLEGGETGADTAMDLAVEMLAGQGEAAPLEEAAEMLAGHGETPALERTAPLMSRDAKWVTEFSKTLGRAGATAFTQMYDPSISAEEYIKAMHAYYSAGMNEGSMAAVYQRVGDVVTAQQASAAYMAGQADRATSLNAEKQAATAEQSAESEVQESEVGDKARHIGKSIALAGRVTGIDGLTKGLQQSFMDGLKTASSEVQQLFEMWRREAQYRLTPSKRSYLRIKSRVITLGQNATASTVAHELFHWADKDYSISSQLVEPLAQDRIALNVAATMAGKDIKEYLVQRYPEAFRLRKSDGQYVMKPEYRGIADILNGLSDGKMRYGYGHSPKYWTDQGTLEAEAWAQFGRHQYENTPEALKMFQELFPNFYKSAMIALKEMM